MDPPVRMGVVVTSILHESIHGLLYFYLSHFILQSVISKKQKVDIYGMKRGAVLPPLFFASRADCERFQ